MKNLSTCIVALSLTLGFGVAQAQPASAPMSKAAPIPSGTTPPNTAPYTPAQADTPVRKKVTSAQRKEAAGVRDSAIKTCASESDAKAKKSCIKTAKETYRRAVTP